MTGKECIPDWVAQILDCRAVDPENVFLCVAWLYRPEDLTKGREPHHATNEVLPSNEIAIINGTTVNYAAKYPRYWSEDDGEFIDEDRLLWRQTYNFHTGKCHPPLRKHCICKGVANPDKTLLNCTNEACNE